MAEPALTEELWASIGDVYVAILAHPFIAGLTDGSLDRHAFRFYVVQDAHYLREFARALSITAACAPQRTRSCCSAGTRPAPWRSSAPCTRRSSASSD